jgi:hypothetical protein
MFLRHVGKHGDRKVAIIFREVPNEPHMCLVVYTELLNQNAHDPMMKCIESDIGQSSECLADALNRSHTKDGKFILQYLHHEGLLKKVNTENIVVTPAPNTQIKLNELNKILDEMKLGEDAVKRLAEMDQSSGMQSPVDVARRMRNSESSTDSQAQGILNDNQLAEDLRKQAMKMSQEAKGLLAESERLMAQADGMDPKPVIKERTRRTKKTESKVNI